jgi:hypothetical protein
MQWAQGAATALHADQPRIEPLPKAIHQDAVLRLLIPMFDEPLPSSRSLPSLAPLREALFWGAARINVTHRPAFAAP